ncbi:hypothetical protein CN514_24000 [Bacillus sp. AFS001701]|nr:hypothetical protein CN514_24000 [Bacillus sp. AFS001701]
MLKILIIWLILGMNTFEIKYLDTKLYWGNFEVNLKNLVFENDIYIKKGWISPSFFTFIKN